MRGWLTGHPKSPWRPLLPEAPAQRLPAESASVPRAAPLLYRPLATSIKERLIPECPPGVFVSATGSANSPGPPTCCPSPAQRLPAACLLQAAPGASGLPATPRCTVPPWALSIQGACVVLEWRAGGPGRACSGPRGQPTLAHCPGRTLPAVPGAAPRALCCHLLALPGTAGSGPGPQQIPGGSLHPRSIQETPEGR